MRGGWERRGEERRGGFEICGRGCVLGFGRLGSLGAEGSGMGSCCRWMPLGFLVIKRRKKASFTLGILSLGVLVFLCSFI